jgi:uncharacterized protein YutE (UPF0331/DUF86 family)
MSDKSPLFVSALELLSHATELYVNGNPKKYKFVVLHLANAIELLLKDSMIDHGISIYKNPKETVTIWACFDELAKQNVQIPEKPIIELLIDDRNTIQHRFGFPDAESVYYYLEQVTGFFKRFLSSHYNLDLAETLRPYLSNEHLGFLGLVEDEMSALSKLIKISPQAAIVQAYKTVEEKILSLIGPYLTSSALPAKDLFWRSPAFTVLMLDLEKSGYLPEGSIDRFSLLRKARNIAAHTHDERQSEVDLDEAFKVAEQIIRGLKKAEENGYRFEDEDSTDQ